MGTKQKLCYGLGSTRIYEIRDFKSDKTDTTLSTEPKVEPTDEIIRSFRRKIDEMKADAPTYESGDGEGVER